LRAPICHNGIRALRERAGARPAPTIPSVFFSICVNNSNFYPAKFEHIQNLDFKIFLIFQVYLQALFYMLISPKKDLMRSQLANSLADAVFNPQGNAPRNPNLAAQLFAAFLGGAPDPDDPAMPLLDTFVRTHEPHASDAESSDSDINSEITAPSASENDASDETTDTGSNSDSDSDDNENSIDQELVSEERNEALQNALRDRFTITRELWLIRAAGFCPSKEHFLKILYAKHPQQAARQVIALGWANHQDPSLNLLDTFFEPAARGDLPALARLDRALQTPENVLRLATHPFHLALSERMRVRNASNLWDPNPGEQDFLDEILAIDWQWFKNASDCLATYHLLTSHPRLETAQAWGKFVRDFNFMKSKRTSKSPWPTLARRYPQLEVPEESNALCTLLHFTPTPPLQKHVGRSPIYRNYCDRLATSNFNPGLFKERRVSTDIVLAKLSSPKKGPR